MPKDRTDIEAFFTQLLQRINEVDEKAKVNKSKVELVENSILKRNKKVNEEIELIKSSLNKIKREIDRIKQKIDYLISEMPNLVRKEDLTTIEKFIDLWKPLKFATIEDIERIINKKLKKLNLK